MLPSQVQLIRDSFAQVEPRAAIAALMFYQRLFALDPSLRALFQQDIEQQSLKLMQALRFAVAAVDNPRELQPVLESLGRRHFFYGVEERHYETVGVALLDALAHVLGPSFTGEVSEAWRTIYAHMAATMKEAAAEVPKMMGAAIDLTDPADASVGIKSVRRDADG
jgi:methyl-accepting chemotaxis protein